MPAVGPFLWHPDPTHPSDRIDIALVVPHALNCMSGSATAGRGLSREKNLALVHPEGALRLHRLPFSSLRLISSAAACGRANLSEPWLVVDI